jgi:F-type H+-transporting ATPase subunit gamma
LLLLIVSDRGLCGSFNLNLIKMTQAWVEERKPRIKNLRMSFCGRQGYAYFKDRVEVRTYYEGATAHPDFSQALRIGREMLTAYRECKYDEIHLAYNINHSPLSQTPTLERILPFDFGKGPAPAGPESRTDYVYEPEGTALSGRHSRKEILQPHLCRVAGKRFRRTWRPDDRHGQRDDQHRQIVRVECPAAQPGPAERHYGELVEIVAGSEALK